MDANAGQGTSGAQRRRAWLRALAALTVGSCVGLAVLEGGARLFLPAYHPGRQIAFHYDAEGTPLGPANATVYQRTPKGDYDLQVRFNRHGLRDPKDLTTATEDDWFVLGDSFAMGWGVPEEARFSDVLDRALPERVFNLAIPTDIAGYEKLLAYARRLGAPVKKLVVSVCMENDLRDYDRAMAARAAAARGGAAARRLPLREWLKLNSALYLLMSHRFQAWAPLREVLESVGIARKIDSHELLLQNGLRPEVLEYEADLLERTVAGTRSLVLIIPSRGLWIGVNREVEDQVHERFVAELRARGLDVLDLRPRLEAGGDPMRYHFATDPHWNEAGHALAGAVLVERLRPAAP